MSFVCSRRNVKHSFVNRQKKPSLRFRRFNFLNQSCDTDLKSVSFILSCCKTISPPLMSLSFTLFSHATTLEALLRKFSNYRHLYIKTSQFLTLQSRYCDVFCDQQYQPENFDFMLCNLHKQGALDM